MSAIIMSLTSSCKEDDEEKCTAGDVGQCELTTCCASGNADECTYKVNGKEYATLNDAIEASSCTAKADLEQKLRAMALEAIGSR